MLALSISTSLDGTAVEMIKAEGSAVSAVGGDVRPRLGRKSKLRHSPVSTEADTVLGTPSTVWVVHLVPQGGSQKSKVKSQKSDFIGF